MTPRDPQILERNIHALLTRAWQPSVPRAEFRAELKALVLRPFAAARAEHVRMQRPVPPEPRPRWALRLALPCAAAALVLAAVALWQSAERSAPRDQAPLHALLADGRSALRHGADEAWSAAPDARCALPADAYLEVRTPASAALRVDVVRSGSIVLDAASHVELESGPTHAGSAVHIKLHAGSALLAHVTADHAWEVMDRVGSMAFSQARVELRRAPAHDHAVAGAGTVGDALFVRVLEGRVAIRGGDVAREIEAGAHGWFADLLDPKPLAPDQRSAVDAHEPDAAPPTAARIDLTVTAVARSSPERLTAFQVDVTPLRYDDGSHVSHDAARTLHVHERSDAAARAIFTDLHPGHYAVLVRAAGFGPWRASDLALGGAHSEVTLEAALQAPQRLRGRVVDARSGAPIAGVAVFSETDCAATWIPIPLDAMAREHAPATFLTDADGRFEVTGLGAHAHRMRAQKSGFAPTWHRVEAVPGAFLELELQPGGGFEGDVRKATHAPLANAIVIALAQFSLAVPDARPSGFARTDAAGHYEMRDLPEGLYLVLLVGGIERAPDAAPPLKLATALVGELTRVDFDFDAGADAAAVVGHLHDAQDRPLAGATLSFVRAGHSLDPAAGGWISTATDRDGRFEITLAAGAHEVFVVDQSGARVERIQQIDVPSAGDLGLRAAGTRISGVVRDADDARAIAGAVCILLGDADAFLGKVESGADGGFAFRYAPHGSLRVFAYPPSESHATVASAPLQSDGNPLVIELRAPKGGVLVVRTRTAAGDPVVGATITARDAAGHDLTHDWPRATGADGTVRIPGLPAQRVFVTAAHGALSRAAEAVIRAGATLEIEIELE